MKLIIKSLIYDRLYFVESKFSNNLPFPNLQMTLTATCIRADDLQTENLGQEDRNKGRKISKRQASLIIDSYPSDSGFEPKSKVIYRRVSRYPPPYRTTRPRHGPPKRTKTVKSRRPLKQKRSKYPPSRYNYKYGPPKSQKKRPPKSKSRPRKPGYVKPVYSASKNRLPKPSAPYRPPEPTGFAEPPSEYINHNPQNFNRPIFSDPPVDSYGAPLTGPTANDYYNQGYPMDNDEQSHVHNQDEFRTWNNDQHNAEPQFAFTKKRPAFVAPETIDDDARTPPLEYHDININNFADTYKHEKNRPLRVQKHYNRHWIAQKPHKDHVIVGGQYAEPPGRYVPKYHDEHHSIEEETHFGPMHEFDAETSASGTISSYVNYKNSNMAFSPQNLNDAFSIVN